MLNKTSKGIAWGHGWHRPVPDLIMPDGKRYPAVISQEWRPDHRGVDIMYKRSSLNDRPEFPAGVIDGGGAKAGDMWFAPIGTPILAARDGQVWSANKIGTGWWVVLDHGAPWATSYHHLASVTVGPKGTPVKAGDQIGTMGHNPNTGPTGPIDGGKLRHLHFEPWYEGASAAASRDPQPVYAQWGVSTWTP
jgi:murein DD-endopeptidase MepM/ murein hydrolase activator NlpD